MLPNYAITIPHKLKTRLHFLSPREWQVTGNTVSQCIQESFTFHQVPCLGQKGDRCHKHNNTHKLPNFKLVEYCLYKKIVASATPPSSVLWHLPKLDYILKKSSIIFRTGEIKNETPKQLKRHPSPFLPFPFWKSWTRSSFP